MIYPLKKDAAQAGSNAPTTALQSAPEIVVINDGRRIEAASEARVIRHETISAVEALGYCMLDSALGG